MLGAKFFHSSLVFTNAVQRVSLGESMSNVGFRTDRIESDRAGRSLFPRARLVVGASVITLGLVITGVAAASSSAPMSAMAGMQLSSTYWGDVAGAPFANNGVTRPYYIAADQVDWNYAPDGTNDITGEPFDDVANTFVATGPGRIGSKYVKCLYRGYTDATFKHLAPRRE